MEPIDYDRLIAAYEADLVDTLRGFGAQSDLLELWVPDEDPVRSLCGMVDAAETAGAERVSIRVGPATAPNIDRSALLQALKDLGNAALAEETDGFLLVVNGLGGARTASPHQAIAESETAALEAGSTVDDRPIIQADSIAASYQAALSTINDFSHEGTAGGPRAEIDGAALSLDIEDQLIAAARHDGARTNVTRGLLERFCALIEGLPLQEAADHGTIRLEFDLRDPAAKPVAGVITPAAADPAFLLPQALIRQAAGPASAANDYDDQPSQRWLEASDWHRREMLAEALVELAGERGFDAEDVVLHDIEYDVRIVVELRGALAAADKQPHMMMLEAGIKQKVDRRLELFQRERLDDNVIRRLAGDDPNDASSGEPA